MSENTRGGKLDRRAFLRGVGAVAVMGGVGLLSDSADARVVPSDATPEQVKDLNSRAAGIAKVIERMGQPVAGLKFHLSKNQNIGSAGHFMVGVEIEGMYRGEVALTNGGLAAKEYKDLRDDEIARAISRAYEKIMMPPDAKIDLLDIEPAAFRQMGVLGFALEHGKIEGRAFYEKEGQVDRVSFKKENDAKSLNVTLQGNMVVITEITPRGTEKMFIRPFYAASLYPPGMSEGLMRQDLLSVKASVYFVN